VFDPAVDDHTVAGVQVPRLPFGMQAYVPARDVHKLMVRMAVPRATPSLHELVPHKHEVRTVGQYLPQHAWFGPGGLPRIRGNKNNSAFSHSCSWKNDWSAWLQKPGKTLL